MAIIKLKLQASWLLLTSSLAFAIHFISTLWHLSISGTIIYLYTSSQRTTGGTSSYLVKTELGMTSHLNCVSIGMVKKTLLTKINRLFVKTKNKPPSNKF